MCKWNCADRIWERQRKNKQQSTMEEVEIFKEFVVLKDNKENPCACVRVYKMKWLTSSNIQLWKNNKNLKNV